MLFHRLYGLKEQFGAEGGANNLTLNQFCLLPEQTYNAVVTKVSILQQGRLGEIRQLARNQGKFFEFSLYSCRSRRWW